MSSHIKVQIEGHVGTITIDRPEYKNALSKEMWAFIPKAVDSCLKQHVRVIVFTGRDNCFAAGADFADLQAIASNADADSLWTAIERALNTVASCPVPTIARIIGPCMGGGCLLAAACDMRFSDLTARFSVPVARLGITLDKHNVGRLCSLVGYGLAAELLFTGLVFSAQRAEQTGLVNAAVPADDLDGTIKGIVEAICANSKSSIEELKRRVFALKTHADLPQDRSEVLKSYLTQDFRARLGALSKERQ